MSCWNNSSKVSKYIIPLLTNSDRSCDVVPNEIGVKTSPDEGNFYHYELLSHCTELSNDKKFPRN